MILLAGDRRNGNLVHLGSQPSQRTYGGLPVSLAERMPAEAGFTEEVGQRASGIGPDQSGTDCAVQEFGRRV
jgi:hypothetical protein